MPAFPWPPPKPTSRAALPRNLLARDPATLGDVARHLQSSLASVGYGEWSYYSAPGGFALATRLEQISADGKPRPDPQRWSTALPTQPVFTLGDYLRALFTAPQGDYRVIVFVVTDQAFAASHNEASEAQAEDWLEGGIDRLPPALAARPFSADSVGSALVYQFRKVGHADAPIANPDGAPSASIQLDISGITAALRK